MKYIQLLIVIAIVFFSCNTVQRAPKALKFRDVEREFHFAKPLSKKSHQVILRQFGTVQNYRDTIYARKQRGNNGFVMVANTNPETGETNVTVLKINKEEFNKK